MNQKKPTSGKGGGKSHGKKKKDRDQSTSSMKQVKKNLLRFFEEHPKQRFNHKQLAAQLGAHSKKDKEMLLRSLEELYLDGLLKETKPGRYKHKPGKQVLTGEIEITRQGYGFVSTDEIEEDIFIPPRKTKNTLTGDLVKVMLYAKRRGDKPEGEVLELLERRKTKFVGTLEVSDKFAFLISDSKKMDVDVFIPKKHLMEGKTGDKAVVELTDWPESAKSPFGKVVRILGRAGEHFTEMNAIIEEFGLPTSFPAAVEKEADRIPDEIPGKEYNKRRDFRDVITFTIDPDDAKDFDDALSIRKTAGGNWEIGVHIADVTHYVRPGTDLEEEAFTRGTSVYLVDRVIPMLPEKLSNKVCSLRPKEEKLTFSAVFELDDTGRVISEWFGKTVIYSDRRFTYEQAQEVIETGKGPFSGELKTLNDIAKKLRDKKFEEGALAFETEEVKFKLDENGKPVGIEKKIRKEAHMLIEDFMLLANRKVAEYIFMREESFKETPFVYRSHDAPPQDKLDNFARIAKRFGYDIEIQDPNKMAASFNRILQNVQGKPEQNMIENLAIRTMAKATYTTKKGSHYGLAFDYYTHFTSPIRRYPDVIAHRLLYHYLTGSKGEINQQEIENKCKHSSEKEVKAEEAERASIKFKQVEYMQNHIGDSFDGVISGVKGSGFFVEILENKCEGMVSMSSLDDDYYILDEENYAIRGTNTNKSYQLGDLVRVQVAKANPVARQLDLELIKGLS